MRVAVSDYDGTLCRNGRVEDGVLAAIADWRKAGHVFGLASGRDFGLLLPEIERWLIPFDFLICVSGAEIYDDALELRHARLMDAATLRRLWTHPALAASLHVVAATGDVARGVIRTGSWFAGSERVEAVSETVLARTTRVAGLALAYEDADATAHWAEQIAAEVPAASAHYNGRCLDITAAGVDKGTAVADLLTLAGWPADGLVAIGDNMNDFPMLQRFNGFVMPESPDALRKIARATAPDVGAILRDILQGENATVS